MCGPRNEEHSEETGTESEMTEGTEETITDPVEFFLPSVLEEECQGNRQCRERYLLQHIFS